MPGCPASTDQNLHECSRAYTGVQATLESGRNQNRYARVAIQQTGQLLSSIHLSRPCYCWREASVVDCTARWGLHSMKFTCCRPANPPPPISLEQQVR